MAVFIYQADALDLLASAEGLDWKARQEAGDFGEYSFGSFKTAWETFHARLTPEQRASPDYRESNITGPNGAGAIYGQDGWHRYVVAWSGEIRFLRASEASPERRQRAEQAGFALWPG